ncbi:hypothetical protein [Nostoc sp.]
MAFQILSGGSIRYAWFAGKVSAPILPYGSVQVGIEKAEDLLGKAFTGTLYLASAGRRNNSYFGAMELIWLNE